MEVDASIFKASMCSVFCENRKACKSCVVNKINKDTLDKLRLSDLLQFRRQGK